MVKRKSTESGDEDEGTFSHHEHSFSHDQGHESYTDKKAKKKKYLKQDRGERESIAKKKKAVTSSWVDGDDNIPVSITSDGEKFIALGKKRRATLRAFKGTKLLDIREFYGDDDDEKPGKKGISLTLEQWETLKRAGETIDFLFTELST